MKISVILVVAGLLSVPFLVQAGEDDSQCDLFTRKCRTEADLLRQEIKKLSAQIREGDKTHSPQELKALKLKLKEARKKLASASSGTAAKTSP